MNILVLGYRIVKENLKHLILGVKFIWFLKIHTMYFLWVKLSIDSDDYVNVDIFAYFKIIKRKWLKQKRGVTLLVPLQWFIHSWIYVWKDSLALFTCINILTALLHKQCSIKIMVPCTKIEKSVFTIAYWQLNHLKLHTQLC